MTTHSSILAWIIPCSLEGYSPGGSEDLDWEHTEESGHLNWISIIYPHLEAQLVSSINVNQMDASQPIFWCVVCVCACVA